VAAGRIFALLGPNGSGKSTLFKILSTLIAYRQGQVRVLGVDVNQHQSQVRHLLGVVFQSPSVDPKLTVRENLLCQATLYGLRGPQLRSRLDQVTQQMGLSERLGDPVGKLSGGQQRRVELAKGILHRPGLLLMDEPSTGLDPAARLELWQILRELQQNHSVTVVLTTHLLEEADKADQIAILDHGKNVAQGSPTALRDELGDQVLSIQAQAPREILQWLLDRSITAQLYQQTIRATGSGVAQLVSPLMETWGNQIQSVTVGRPSLEDVFMARTGHYFAGSNTTTAT
jgi:ABC-2 type transport system ATP-binding protein